VGVGVEFCGGRGCCGLGLVLGLSVGTSTGVSASVWCRGLEVNKTECELRVGKCAGVDVDEG